MDYAWLEVRTHKLDCRWEKNKKNIVMNSKMSTMLLLPKGHVL